MIRNMVVFRNCFLLYFFKLSGSSSVYKVSFI